MAHDLFISYSSKDKAIGDAVCACLERRGIRCWMAPRDIQAGTEWTEAIMRGIRASRVMVLVFSANSNASTQVRRELQQAFDRGLTVIPFRIANVAPQDGFAYYLDGVHWLDAITPPLEVHLEDLAVRVLSILRPGERSDAIRQPVVGAAPKRSWGKFVVGGAAAVLGVVVLSVVWWLGWARGGPGVTGVLGPSTVASPATLPEDVPSLQKVAEGGSVVAMRRLGRMYADGNGVEKDYLLAKKWSEQAVEKGDVEAMCDLGSLYYFGRGVGKDYKRGVALYQRAADTGSARGMRDMGWAYRDGHGVYRDYAAALGWFQRAAAAGDSDGMWAVGDMYEKGLLGVADYPTALSWYRKAADAGNSGAMVAVGLMYENGRGVDRDYGVARDWYGKAAGLGDGVAMTNIGKFFLTGRGTEQDFGEAARWFQKGIAAGDSGGMVAMGYLYEDGKGVAQDRAKAREWFEKAVSAGNAEGMRAVAMEDLLAVDKTSDTAAQDRRQIEGAKLLRMAAILGNSDAVNDFTRLLRDVDLTGWDRSSCLLANLALYYVHDGPAQNVRRAIADANGMTEQNGGGGTLGSAYFFSLVRDNDPDALMLECMVSLSDRPEAYAKNLATLQKAADAGQTAAMAYLGMCYGEGRWTAEDDAAAVKWYVKAADLGSAVGMRQLGRSYRDGKGNARDASQAMTWLNHAVDYGDVDAMVDIGALYAAGDGVKQDGAAARQWYDRAAAAGSAEALYRIALLYRDGIGVAKDAAQAETWFKKATQSGDAPVMAAVAKLYETGDGVPTNLALARQLYGAAAARGNADATKWLAEHPAPR